MHMNNKYCSDYSLSPQLTKRSDPKSVPDGGGDVTEDNALSSVQKHCKSSVFCDKRTGGPAFSGDPADWKQADYDYNINLLYDYMVNQKRYMKLDDDKYARNKELLANMKTMRQQAYDDSLQKTTETKHLTREIEGYEWQIKHHSALGASSKIRFLAEDQLNRDLKEQKKRLLKEKEFQLRKQIEEGILQDVIEEHESAKQLLETEQDKSKRLQQKAEWYGTEIANIREVLGQHENKEIKNEDRFPKNEKAKASLGQQKADSSSNTNAANFLPEINKGRNNLITLLPIEENVRLIQNRGGYNQSVQNANADGHVPHLPPDKNAHRYVPYPPTVATTHVHENKEIRNKDRLQNNEEGKVSLGQQKAGNSPNKNASHFLPEIKKGRNNMNSLLSVEENVRLIRDQGGYNQSAQNANADGHVPHLPLVTNAHRYVPHPPTVAATHGHVPLPPTVATTHGHVPHPPTVATTHGHVPHPPTVATTHGHVPHPPTVVATHGHVPHPPTAVTKHGRVPQPPVGKKDGRLRRVFKKLKNAIK